MNEMQITKEYEISVSKDGLYLEFHFFVDIDVEYDIPSDSIEIIVGEPRN